MKEEINRYRCRELRSILRYIEKSNDFNLAKMRSAESEAATAKANLRRLRDRAAQIQKDLAIAQTATAVISPFSKPTSIVSTGLEIQLGILESEIRNMENTHDAAIEKLDYLRVRHDEIDQSRRSVSQEMYALECVN